MLIWYSPCIWYQREDLLTISIFIFPVTWFKMTQSNQSVVMFWELRLPGLKWLWPRDRGCRPVRAKWDNARRMGYFVNNGDILVLIHITLRYSWSQSRRVWISSRPMRPTGYLSTWLCYSCYFGFFKQNVTTFIIAFCCYCVYWEHAENRDWEYKQKFVEFCFLWPNG